MKNIDILAIGDIVTDAFIKIKEATVTCEVDHKNCKLCVAFGEKIPYESVDVLKAVGNSANAAVSASRLGLSSALLSYVGDDMDGKDCILELEKNNVITDYVRTEKGKKTNYHYVLWYDVERTILIKHEQFSYSLGDIAAPRFIYLSSLGENSLPFHTEIVEFVKNNPETKLAFQPGTFQIKLGKDALKEVYAHTEVFFCNVEEAQKILSVTSRDIKSLMKSIGELGPKYVFITDGIEGAYAYDGTEYWFMPVFPHTPFERTGAGDAFASTVVSALLLGLSTKEALMWGPINSMSVVQQVGAQKGLLSREALEEHLKNAPDTYKAQQI
ncbi:MAG: carbohydrate kinase family protein [Candidatus Zambryskibacteria bacterium]|nr:carbohydrate kinase family protein [Candidatus Zambryskibacteria bacterium]